MSNCNLHIQEKYRTVHKVIANLCNSFPNQGGFLQRDEVPWVIDSFISSHGLWKYHSINFQISNSNVSENEDLTSSNDEFWQIHWEHMLTNQWVSAARGPLFVSSASHTGPRERPRYLTRSSEISWMVGCISVCFRVIIQWNAQIYTEYAPAIILCYGYYESWSTY